MTPTLTATPQSEGTTGTGNEIDILAHLTKLVVDPWWSSETHSVAYIGVVVLTDQTITKSTFSPSTVQENLIYQKNNNRLPSSLLVAGV